MKKKNYISKAVMIGALLAPIGMPTVSVLADRLSSPSWQAKPRARPSSRLHGRCH